MQLLETLYNSDSRAIESGMNFSEWWPLSLRPKKRKVISRWLKGAFKQLIATEVSRTNDWEGRKKV